MQYLEALSQIFENGLLSKKRVLSVEAKPLLSMQSGLSFFTTWCNQCYKEGTQHVMFTCTYLCVHILYLLPTINVCTFMFAHMTYPMCISLMVARQLPANVPVCKCTSNSSATKNSIISHNIACIQYYCKYVYMHSTQHITTCIWCEVDTMH